MPHGDRTSKLYSKKFKLKKNKKNNIVWTNMYVTLLIFSTATTYGVDRTTVDLNLLLTLKKYIDLLD